MSTTQAQVGPVNNFMPGELVEVLSEAEILATLDENGTFDKLPFMPEMLKFCGKQFRVSLQAFKTCVDDQEMREFNSTVFLEEARCDGSSHGGCGRACLIFWKSAWLRRAGTAANGNQVLDRTRPRVLAASNQKPREDACAPTARVSQVLDRTRPRVLAASNQKPREDACAPTARVSVADLHSLAEKDGQFFCQSTEILNASKPLPWYEPTQYVRDLTQNRTSPIRWAQSMFIAFYNKLAYILKFKSWRFVAGENENFMATPLNLKAGDLVRVKSLEQIRQTLDPEGKNNNLLFAPTMLSFCGQTMRVQDRVENIILEATTKQRKIKDTVLLEGATCDGVCHRLCPRQSFLFWRECWLEKI